MTYYAIELDDFVLCDILLYLIIIDNVNDEFVKSHKWKIHSKCMHFKIHNATKCVNEIPAPLIKQEFWKTNFRIQFANFEITLKTCKQVPGEIKNEWNSLDYSLVWSCKDNDN